MNTDNVLLEKISNLIRKSVTLKLVTITILMLLLLIPASMIQSIIQERERLNSEVTKEVSAMWASEQQITGPILTIPLECVYEQDNKHLTTTKYWHMLPENLEINGEIIPKRLHRGMYEVVVYNSKQKISGDFMIHDEPDLPDLKAILYDRAFLTIGISDLRGILNQMYVRWSGDDLKVIPGSRLPELVRSGVTVNIPGIRDQIGRKTPFSLSADLRGSRNISFVPVGNTTIVNLVSTWESPSFTGDFLPHFRQLNRDGFAASWSVLQLNRGFPQSWTGAQYHQQMLESGFGVDLILAPDDYQKSHRTAKYAALMIALTFLAFFLFEILNKKRVHPFQYALVGFALCLFYILLVSISEHSNFNLAYGVSTAVIVAMVALYSHSVFRRLKLSMILTTVLCGMYGFLFIVLQLADYALLMGSIGLTLILGMTMYFTRDINWYALRREED